MGDEFVSSDVLVRAPDRGSESRTRRGQGRNARCSSSRADATSHGFGNTNVPAECSKRKAARTSSITVPDPTRAYRARLPWRRTETPAPQLP